MSLTEYPNVEKLARLFDWALGVVFSLLTLAFFLVLILILAALVLQ